MTRTGRRSCHAQTSLLMDSGDACHFDALSPAELTARLDWPE